MQRKSTSNRGGSIGRESAEQRSAKDSTELRNVTILFADIAKSTQTLLSLEPDEARSYLDRVVELMATSVRKFGGAIGQIQGDGLLAVFGAPAASEDHALRAGLAAIEIRDSVARLPQYQGRAAPVVRVGVHSGGASTRVRQIDDSLAFDAIGAVVHLAAKIQERCPPGGVAASAATLKLIRGYVRSRPIGALALAEDETPLLLEELLELSPDYQLAHYFSRRRVTPLVGRQAELERLADAVRMKANTPRIVGIVGEPGMGKSRLCFEAQSIAAGAGHRVAEIRGVSLNSATPFAPLAPFLAQLLIVDDPANRDQEFASKLRTLGLDAAEVDAVSAIFRVQRQDVDWKAVSADARKRAVINGIVKIIDAVATTRPLVIIVEDVHDIDHETMLCIRAAGAPGAGRVAMLLTARPEGLQQVQNAGASVFGLAKLSLQEARRLAHNTLQGAGVELRSSFSTAIEEVVERANGNPFVLEELLRNLISSRARGIGRVPISIEILIRSRIDKLSPPAQHLLHCASVIGVRCSSAVLREISALGETQFEKALRELVDEKFLIADAGFWVEFAHQIARDACYEGIVRETRAALHERVLSAVAAGRDGQIFSFEALANHAYHSNKPDRALDFLWEACRESAAHSAILSVKELRARALAICEEVGEAAALRAVDFDVSCFDALQQLGEFREVVGSLEGSLRVLATKGAERRRCQVCADLATTYWVLARYREAHSLARQALAIAEATKDLPLTVHSKFVLACIEFNRGRPREAARLQQELADALGGALKTARFGAVTVMGLMSRSFLCWYLTDLGRLDEAEIVIGQALQVVDVIEQPYSQALCFGGAGYRLYRTGDALRACELFAKAYDLCQAASFRGLESTISGWYAASLFLHGEYSEAQRLVNLWSERNLGRNGYLPSHYYVYDTRAKLLARDGDYEEALRVIDHGVRTMARARDPVHMAYAAFAQADLKRRAGRDRSEWRKELEHTLRRARRMELIPLQLDCERALSS